MLVSSFHSSYYQITLYYYYYYVDDSGCWLLKILFLSLLLLEVDGNSFFDDLFYRKNPGSFYTQIGNHTALMTNG